MISRLLGDGQSTALIGDPRIGETSFFNYLAYPGLRDELYKGKAERMYTPLIVQWKYADFF